MLSKTILSTLTTHRTSTHKNHSRSKNRYHHRESKHRYSSENTKEIPRKKNNTLKWMLIGFAGTLSAYMIVKVTLEQTRRKNEFVKDLTGSYVLVTGGNSGIGYETALALAGMNGNVVIASRDIGKTAEAAKRIRDISGNQYVYTATLDLGSFDSIRAFVSDCEKYGWKFDYLVNNSGMISTDDSKTKSGYPKNFGVNYVGPFLLTVLLLNNKLIKDDGRIINVSSDAHRRGVIDFDDLASESMNPVTSYSTSKLANVYFTVELRKRLEERDSHIKTVCLHPGVVNTGFFNILPEPLNTLLSPIKSLLLTAKQGAQTTLYCTLNPEIINGAYYDNCQVSRPDIDTTGEVAYKLWEWTEKACDVTLNNKLN
eukprot:TRINITY_DN2274_c0_g1_i1.p1 TRINITY_DN2274_c0_g1~~TRINITY_DN2274_c0_g1_i1.p1  ORF type:complete len:388 (-),score=67.76 TRINITY_DN2274_c0_g1_i1:138-1247(-)